MMTTIKVTLDLSRYSIQQLLSFLAEGVISKEECTAELESRGANGKNKSI